MAGTFPQYRISRSEVKRTLTLGSFVASSVYFSCSTARPFTALGPNQAHTTKPGNGA